MSASEEGWDLRDRLLEVAQPCLIWGMSLLVLSGAAYFYYLPQEYDMNVVVLTLARQLLIAGALWCLPHAAILWYLHRGGRTWAVLALCLGPVATVGIAGAAYGFLEYPLVPLLAALVTGALFALEFAPLVRILRGRSA